MSNHNVACVSPIGLQDAFLVLGSQRSQSFMQEMGVPHEMAQHPEQLASIARTFTGRCWESLNNAPDYDAFGQTVLSFWQEAFVEMRAAYGESASRDLRGWAQRHFMALDLPNNLLLWSSLLAVLADAYGLGPPSVPSPLTVEQTQRFVTLVRARFSLESMDHDYRRIEQARALPLDAFEQHWLAIEPERFRDRDLLLHVQRTLNRERAFQVWNAIEGWLSEADREQLVNWGRETWRDVPPELVRAPERSIR